VRKRMFGFVAAMAMLSLLSGISTAAPSFLSTTGNILTPDDLLLSAGSFSANFHSVEVGDSSTILGANVGVTPNLELGIARFSPDVGDSETIINGKYMILAETSSRPSLVVGVVDATGDLDPDDDPGFYIVLGKTLTSMASGIAGEPVGPMRGFLGVGSGIYNGLFLGVDWAISARTSIMAEFINELAIKRTIGEDSAFNVGLRFAITEGIRGDVALIDGDDLGFGISYTKLGL